MTSRELDILLDEGVASYGSREPRAGLQQRILRRTQGGASRFPHVAPGWALAASVALCVAAGLFILWQRHPSFLSSLDSPLLLEWCQRLQSTWIGTSIRESTLMFPFIEGTHVLALALMIGPAMMWDLRLAGILWTRDPVSKLKKHFLPVTFGGFFVMVTTGSLLFWSEPVKCYHSGYFRIKVLLLALAGINALIFHSTIDRKLAEWDTMLPPPPRARWAGILSLLLWTGVIFAGRYTAYNLI